MDATAARARVGLVCATIGVDDDGVSGEVFENVKGALFGQKGLLFGALAGGASSGGLLRGGRGLSRVVGVLEKSREVGRLSEGSVGLGDVVFANARNFIVE